MTPQAVLADAADATNVIAGVFARVGGRNISLPEGALGRRTFGDWDMLVFANIDRLDRIKELERCLRQFPDHRLAVLLDTRRANDRTSFRTLTEEYPVYAVIELALAPRLRPLLAFPETPWLRHAVASRLTAPESTVVVRSAQTLGPYDLLIVAAAHSLEALAEAIQHLGETRLKHLPEDVRTAFPNASSEAHVFLELLTTFGPSVDPLLASESERSIESVTQNLHSTSGRVGIPAVRLRGVTGHFSCIAGNIPEDLKLFPHDHWYWRPGVFECVLRPVEPLSASSSDVFRETTRLLQALEPAANVDADVELFRSDTTWLFPLHATEASTSPANANDSAPGCCDLILDGAGNAAIPGAAGESGDAALDRLLDGFAALSRDPLQASCVRSLRGPLMLLRKWVVERQASALNHERGLSYHAREEDLGRLLATLAEVMSERAAHTSHALRASVSFRFAGAAQKACHALEHAAREAIRVFVGAGEIPQIVVHFEVCSEPRAITTPSASNEAITIIEVPDTWLSDPSVFLWVIHNALHATRLPPADNVDWWTPLAATVATLIDERFAARCPTYEQAPVRARYRDEVLQPAIAHVLREQASHLSARQLLTGLQRRMAAPDDHVRQILALLAHGRPSASACADHAPIAEVSQLLAACAELDGVLAPVIDAFLEGLIDLRAGWLVGPGVYWQNLRALLVKHGTNAERCQLLDYCWGDPSNQAQQMPYPKLAELFAAVNSDHGTRRAPEKFQMPDIDKGEWLAWLLSTWTP